MDKYYGNVCELDIIFNFQKAYFILDELLLAGEMQESSKKNVLRCIGQQDSLEDLEVRAFSLYPILSFAPSTCASLTHFLPHCSFSLPHSRPCSLLHIHLNLTDCLPCFRLKMTPSPKSCSGLFPSYPSHAAYTYPYWYMSK